MIKKYKIKNPENYTVEAIKVDLKDGREELCKFLEGTKYFFNDSHSVVIHTPNFMEGLEAHQGKYLIKLPLNSYFVMNEEEFNLVYEEISD